LTKTEGEGFEPSSEDETPETVFETAAFNRSATPPGRSWEVDRGWGPNLARGDPPRHALLSFPQKTPITLSAITLSAGTSSTTISADPVSYFDVTDALPCEVGSCSGLRAATWTAALAQSREWRSRST